jgi:glycerol-3-phosphate acyltransferase PlsX
VLLDSGANAECTPQYLVQFAQMGAVFAARRYGIERPRVALLSIGEEETKGTPLVKETHALLSKTPGIEFIGNVEGRDLIGDTADVVVTDGFTGNVALKTLEGALAFLVGAVSAALPAESLAPLLPLAAEMDPDATGGAMLLGVDGVCVISHGSSSSRAIVNGIRVAKEMVEADLVADLRDAVA